jgi:uncharacterized membrane protein
MLRSRLPYWTFATLSLLVGLVALRWLVVPFGESMEIVVHYLDGQAVPLWVHITSAPVAMLAGILQPVQSLRDARPRLHRWTGYIYALAVLAGGVSALAMLPGFLGSTWAATGFAGLAIAWIGTTVIGIARARAGDYQAHRRWMLRSLALTFAAVTLRVYMPFLIVLGGMTEVQTYDVTGWLCWVPNLVAVEWWLSRRRRPAAAFA